MDYYYQTANYFYYPPSMDYFYMRSNPIDQSLSYSNVCLVTENFGEILPLEQNSSNSNQINEQVCCLQSDSN
jgi:hypothetical protein